MRSLLRLLLASLFTIAGTEAHAAWYQAKSKHFIIYANEDPKDLRQYAQNLERFDQAVRELFGMGDPPLTDAGRINIFVLPSLDDVSRLIGISYAGGMYQGRASGSFAFVPNIRGDSNYSQVIFFHEYTHHLQLQDAEYAVPIWFREGFADFLSSAEIEKDGSVLFGKVPPNRAWAALKDREMPVREMLGETYGKLNSENAGYIYGRGWLLTDYLTVEPSRKGQLTAYLVALSKGLRPLDAAQSAFGDLNQLERELDVYTKGRLSGFTVKAREMPASEITLRALGAGEAAVMNVRIHSKRGVNRKTAPAVAADARKVAAGYPNDHFVQSCLAEAEYDARNYPAAEAAADRAIEIDPTDAHALIYKGRAEAALAKEKPEAADWNSIRAWFIKANKIDTENAEPLALFYETYKEADQQPTQNAVDALLYAVRLAPQDEGVRMEAVTELLTEGKVAEAKNAFAPIAHQPHLAAQARDLTDKIMKAIDQGDAKGALTLIEDAQRNADAEKKKKDS